MTETFRPRSNYVWAIIAIGLILLFAANSLTVNSNPLQIVLEIVLCIALICVCCVIWIKPRLTLRDQVIEVVNPFKTELIPYADVLELQTKWALKIIHRQGQITVWVAPASGKRKWIAEKRFGILGSSIPLSDMRHNVSDSMSGSLDSFSGQAAYMIRERIKRLH